MIMQEKHMREHLATLIDDFRRPDSKMAREIAVVHYRGNRRHATTYGELARMAGRFAAFLAAQNIGLGDRVLIWAENSAEWVAAFHGCLLRGVLAVPLDAAGSADFAARVAADVHAKLAVGDTLLLSNLAAAKPELPTLAFDDWLNRLPTAEMGAASGLTHETPLQILFTSGTTGDPKAVLHLHNTTNSAVRFANHGHDITAESVVLVLLPAGLNWGLINVLQGQEAGCTLIMMDVFDAVAAMRLIERERVTYFCCAPAHLVAMLNSPEIDQFDLSSLDMVVTGGASCPIEVIRAFRARLRGHLIELYGMLETGFQSWTRRTDDPEAVCGTCGPCIPQVESRILDDDDRTCPPGNVGEIVSRGPSVTIGYYNNADANARSFMERGWFRTGDLGTLDAQGLLRIVGRKKEMIIRGGANIYPREIEEVLYQHPDIMDAAVIGIPDARLGERTCACIVPRPGRSVSFADVIDFLRPKIATYKLPETVQVLDSLPRTPTGKIQKDPLRAMILRKLAPA